MSAGIPASELTDDDLERELTHVHEKRHDVFLTGTADQLLNNVARMLELEKAFLERFGERVPDADAKIAALQAGPGDRAMHGSTTQPLARGQHTERGWQDTAGSAAGGAAAGSSSTGSSATGSFSTGNVAEDVDPTGTDK